MRESASRSPQDRTTSDGKDVWFIGFSSDLVVGLYLGYDKPRIWAGPRKAAIPRLPIVKDFMKLALADKPATPFKIPPGIRLVRIDAKSGMRPGQGEGGRTILEAFQAGTAPPDNYAAVGVADQDGRMPPQVIPPDAGNMQEARLTPAISWSGRQLY